jgi:hypothetical protein
MVEQYETQGSWNYVLPILCCGFIVHIRFTSCCGDIFVDVGIWLVMLLVRVACRTVWKEVSRRLE